MGYPYYPKNRLIVNGVDLTDAFKMVLSDGYVLNPPEPKTYTVEIPGGNGVLDLTESIFGDVTYKNRKQEFTFYIINVDNFEKFKTEISNMLHGKTYNYQMSMDPLYTYTGRFSVTSYTHSVYNLGKVGVVKIAVDAKPYKMKPEQVYTISAIGGEVVYVESGRLRVRPTIECDGVIKVIYNNKQITLPQGTWTLNDLVFTEGVNEIYFNSYDIHNLKWGDLKDRKTTWSEFKNNRLFEWYKSNGDGTYIDKLWSDLEGVTWGDLSEYTWAQQMLKWDIEIPVKNIYLKYDWGDL